MLYILFNLVVLVVEVAAIIAVGYVAYLHPLAFALLSAGLVLALGFYLEFARLKHEIPFYTKQSSVLQPFFVALFSVGSTLAKAVVIGLVALMTFSGTDPDRQFIVVVIFAATLFFGTSLLRWLARRFGVNPARWGYFRLALPLGVFYAAGLWLAARLAFLATPSAADLTRKIFVDTPARPSLSQASELLFQLKQYVDGVLLGLLNVLVPAQVADVISIVVSANVLVGMVLAVYAVVIAEGVRFAENRR